MLLDRLDEDDAQVLVLRGPVGPADAGSLRQAVTDALGAGSRGVVVDLSQTETLTGDAVEALAAAATAAGGWPGPSLAVCGAPSSVRSTLEPLFAVHDDRRAALAHLDHQDGEVCQVVVDHGPHGPRQAREAVQRWSGALGLGALADDLLLIVSELVTNAVRYGKPPVSVAVSADDRTVTVGVVDGADARPVARRATDDAESGRGLLLLSMLSAQHGVRPDPPGKVVWACLPRE